MSNEIKLVDFNREQQKLLMEGLINKYEEEAQAWLQAKKDSGAKITIEGEEGEEELELESLEDVFFDEKNELFDDLISEMQSSIDKDNKKPTLEDIALEALFMKRNKLVAINNLQSSLRGEPKNIPEEIKELIATWRKHFTSEDLDFAKLKNRYEKGYESEIDTVNKDEAIVKLMIPALLHAAGARLIIEIQRDEDFNENNTPKIIAELKAGNFKNENKQHRKILVLAILFLNRDNKLDYETVLAKYITDSYLEDEKPVLKTVNEPEKEDSNIQLTEEQQETIAELFANIKAEPRGEEKNFLRRFLKEDGFSATDLIVEIYLAKNLVPKELQEKGGTTISISDSAESLDKNDEADQESEVEEIFEEVFQNVVHTTGIEEYSQELAEYLQVLEHELKILESQDLNMELARYQTEVLKEVGEVGDGREAGRVIQFRR